jgi:hypothetical protein
MIDFNAKDYLGGELAPGVYSFRIKDVSLKGNKNNEGKHLAVLLEVVSDFRKGKTIFDNINIYNASKAAQEMAREKLAGLLKVLDMIELRDLHKLINHVVDAEVIEDNKVKKYLESIRSATAEDAQIDFLAPNDKFNDEIPF